MTWQTVIVILGVFLMGGCAQISDVFAPSKPSAPMPVPVRPERREPPPPPPPPPPRLAPQLSPEQEGHLMDETTVKIQDTERALQAIDTRRLTSDQQEALQTIYAFIAQAKAALSRKDFSQAQNLAQKARILSDELSRQASR